MRWNKRRNFYKNVSFAEWLLRHVNWIALVVGMGLWVALGWRVALIAMVCLFGMLVVGCALYAFFVLLGD